MILKDLIVNGVARIVGKIYASGGFVGNLEGTANKATDNTDGGRLGGCIDGGTVTVSALMTTCSTRNGITAGSFNNSAASGDLPAGWTNFIYVPHRIGAGAGDNSSYGTMYLTQMNSNTRLLCIAHRYTGTNYNPIKVDANSATTAGSCTGNAATATTAKNIPTASGQGNIWIE